MVRVWKTASLTFWSPNFRRKSFAAKVSLQGYHKKLDILYIYTSHQQLIDILINIIIFVQLYYISICAHYYSFGALRWGPIPPLAMPRTLRVEYAQGSCRRHLKNSIILQRQVSFAKPFGAIAVLVWFMVEVWFDRCRDDVTQACMVG